MTTAASVAALNLFIPITKIDAAQRIVYGIATAETVDRAGEVCDYESTKPYYEKWSGDIAKASGGKSLGNLRAMHGKVAAGKVTDINFNDDAKQIEIAAKVVDDNEWKKVEEGVYTGFSQGGAYVKRWKDGDVQKYTAEPSEVSLVDLPCLPTATFEVVKADGSSEMRKFVTVEVKEPTNDEIVAKATELAKAAGKDGFADFIVQAREDLMKAIKPAEKPAEESGAADAAPQVQIEKTASASAAGSQNGDEYEQVWLSKRDGKTFKTKAELRKHHDELDAAAVVEKSATPVQAALADLSATLGIKKADGDAKPGAKDTAADADKTADDAGKDAVTGEKKKKKAKKFETADALQKGLYDVGRLANLICELNWFAADANWERSAEGDDSTLPEQLKSAVASLCQALRDMVAEETAELFDPENANDALLIQVLEMAAGVPDDAMKALVKMAETDENLAKSKDAILKAGARHSKKDQEHIQATHDHSVMAGAECGADAEKMAKQADDLQKAMARGDALQKAFDELLPQIDEIKKAVQHLMDQPMPHPATRVVTKAQDNGGAAEMTPEDMLAKMSPDQLATLAIKLSQQNGQSILSRGR